jgi:hypothetical protein
MDFKREVEDLILTNLRKSLRVSNLKTKVKKPSDLIDTSTERFGFKSLKSTEIRP